MYNNLLRPKKSLSVSAPVGEENIAHEWAAEFFLSFQCVSALIRLFSTSVV